MLDLLAPIKIPFEVMWPTDPFSNWIIGSQNSKSTAWILAFFNNIWQNSIPTRYIIQNKARFQGERTSPLKAEIENLKINLFSRQDPAWRSHKQKWRHQLRLPFQFWSENLDERKCFEFAPKKLNHHSLEMKKTLNNSSKKYNQF